MMYIQYLVMYILEFCDDSATCKCHKHLIMRLQPPSMECQKNIGNGNRNPTQMVTANQ